jgi:phosphotransferase system IIB component
LLLLSGGLIFAINQVSEREKFAFNILMLLMFIFVLSFSVASAIKRIRLILKHRKEVQQQKFNTSGTVQMVLSGAEVEVDEGKVGEEDDLDEYIEKQINQYGIDYVHEQLTRLQNGHQ